MAEIQINSKALSGSSGMISESIVQESFKQMTPVINCYFWNGFNPSIEIVSEIALFFKCMAFLFQNNL